MAVHRALIVVMAFVGLLLGGPALAKEESKAAESQPIKIACVGDSITFGAGIKDRTKNCYPAQLGRMLGKNYAVKNFGVNAATLLKKGNKPYWKLGTFKAAKDYQPDIVIIKLGTNDTKPGNWKHKARFKPDYIEMVKTFQKLKSKPKVYVCYPVPVFPERWGISDKTVREEVIPLVDEVAKATGAVKIDLYAVLKGKPELVPDKVHPNAKGAGLMAKHIAIIISAKQKIDEGKKDAPSKEKAKQK